MDTQNTKAQTILRRVIISIFVVVTIGMIVFTMGVDAPILPAEDHHEYMLEENGKRVSCLFPIANLCQDQQKAAE